MPISIVAVYDSKAEAYKPFFEQSRGTALRSFQAALKDPQSNISQNPEDFSLFFIGEFDEQSGQCAIREAPVIIANAWEIRE